jgi:hypothetical protein
LSGAKDLARRVSTSKTAENLESQSTQRKPQGSLREQIRYTTKGRWLNFFDDENPAYDEFAL